MAVLNAQTLLLENWKHRFQTDAMPGAEATTTTAELDPRQAGDWSLGAGIWGEYQNSIKKVIKECQRSSEPFPLL